MSTDMGYYRCSAGDWAPGRSSDAAQQPEGAGAPEPRLHHRRDRHRRGDMRPLHSVARTHERVQGVHSSRLCIRLRTVLSTPPCYNIHGQLVLTFVQWSCHRILCSMVCYSGCVHTTVKNTLRLLQAFISYTKGGFECRDKYPDL